MINLWCIILLYSFEVHLNNSISLSLNLKGFEVLGFWAIGRVLSHQRISPEATALILPYWLLQGKWLTLSLPWFKFIWPYYPFIINKFYSNGDYNCHKERSDFCDSGALLPLDLPWNGFALEDRLQQERPFAPAKVSTSDRRPGQLHDHRPSTWEHW